MGKSFFSDKTKKKIKEKRFYIVLACCVLSISAIAFTNSLRSKTNLPAENKNSDVEYSLPTPIADEKNSSNEQKKPLVLIEEHLPPTTTKEPEITTDVPEEVPVTHPPEIPEAIAEADTKQAALEKIFAPTTGEIIFGYSKKPLYSEITDDWRTHEAIDYLAPEGSMVYAAAKGKITQITDSGLYGASITIDHGNSMTTVYSNVAADGIAVGDFVEAGDVIGICQNTAVCEKYDEDHIHFEVMIDNKNVDPNEWM